MYKFMDSLILHRRFKQYIDLPCSQIQMRKIQSLQNQINLILVIKQLLILYLIRMLGQLSAQILKQTQYNSQERYQHLPLIYSNEKWVSSIKPTLVKIKQSKSSIDTVKLLKLLYQKAYRLRYGPNERIDKHSFKELYSQYSDSIDQIFSRLAQIVLSFQNHNIKINILYTQCEKQISFNKQIVLLFMAMMALGLTAIYSDRHSFPNVSDFGFIFSQENYKTKTIIEYLKLEIKNFKPNPQILTIGRLCSKKQLPSIMDQFGHNKMNKLVITEDEDSIQNYYGHLKVDFANMYIGGGALLGGLVQEEIMFANHPEMYISVLFCEVMAENEAIYFAGFKKYWKNSGYSYTTQFQGRQELAYELDNRNRPKQYIVAIDALHFYSKQSGEQFQKKYIDRQIVKSLTGFRYQIESDEIVTGNWGCGAFSGNHSLKLLIQWISCSLVGKKMRYCPFGFKDQLKDQKLFKIFQKMKVKQLYEFLVQSSKQITKGQLNIIQLFSKSLVQDLNNPGLHQN